MIDFNTQTAHQSLDFDSLKTLCLSCENCSLSEQRTNVVFGSGKPDSDVMIIGEGPGANEDEQGVPFIGVTRLIYDLHHFSSDSNVFYRSLNIFGYFSA